MKQKLITFYFKADNILQDIMAVCKEGKCRCEEETPEREPNDDDDDTVCITKPQCKDLEKAMTDIFGVEPVNGGDSTQQMF